MKKVSIIIPTFNNWKYTMRCLDSIFKNSGESLGEVIVVDNGSTDETLSEIEKYNVVLIKNKENLGFAKACNQGAKKAKYEYLLFLNNDTEVTNGWLDALNLEIIKEKVGIVGPKLIYPNGLIQHIGIAFDKNLNHHSLYYKFSEDKEQVNKKREFQAIIAASILINKKLFLKVGGFDEIYKNGSEDLDLCFKVRKLGYKVLYVPSSVVIHHESVSVGKQEKKEKLMKENRKILHERWDYFIKPDLEEFYYKDGFLDYFSNKEKQCEERGKWIEHLEKDNSELRKALEARKNLIKTIKYYVYKVQRKCRKLFHL